MICQSNDRFIGVFCLKLYLMIACLLFKIIILGFVFITFVKKGKFKLSMLYLHFNAAAYIELSTICHKCKLHSFIEFYQDFPILRKN